MTSRHLGVRGFKSHLRHHFCRKTNTCDVFIGLIMIIIGLLTALYASDTSLSQQIVPVYYFISFVLVFVGIYGLVSIIRD